jgi:lipopolysaccharide biosynthesis glycosyltransferase
MSFLLYCCSVKRFTIGYICSGTDYAEMSVVSLYSLYKSLNKDFNFSEIIDEIMIVTDASESVFITFAESIHSNVRVIKPSNWSGFGFPAYSGNYVTYWKFDLLFNLSPNQFLIYLDSDAFVVGKFDLDFIINRINDSQEKDSLLMVPSHRPNLEKTGFINSTNPYNYYNSGFAVIAIRRKFDMDKLLQHRRAYYPKSYEAIIWSDQDLINSYFQNYIEPLPFRYNVSTGMIKKANFGPNTLNYLVLNDFKNAVIVHASGGILKSKKYYPYRKVIKNIANAGLLDSKNTDFAKMTFQKFISIVEMFDSTRINNLRQFLGWTAECSPLLYAEELYWKQTVKKFLKKLNSWI